MLTYCSADVVLSSSLKPHGTMCFNILFTFFWLTRYRSGPSGILCAYDNNLSQT